jgi:SAM-dependent methyltransferase
MGKMLNIVRPLHNKTKRDCEARYADNKVEAMLVAEQYGEDYWNGDRRYGYGGYNFIPGRQAPIAEALIQEYGLSHTSSILDIGCGKGFLLYEFKRLLPGISVTGLDISTVALKQAHDTVKYDVLHGDARGPLPFGDTQFDLTISINTLHNLFPDELPRALDEMQRVSLRSFLCVESYHDRQSQHNLQGWALTCNTFMPIRSWIWFFDEHEFTGDYEFTEF